MATIYRTDLSEESLSLPTDAAARLRAIQDAVGGDIEAVGVRRGTQVMYINEEGKILGLPLNRAATVLARDAIPAGDYIVGDVVVFTEAETRVDLGIDAE
jgi:hypothetical protein